MSRIFSKLPADKSGRVVPLKVRRRLAQGGVTKSDPTSRGYASSLASINALHTDAQAKLVRRFGKA